MKVSVASLGDEPAARFLEQVKLAEELGFANYFHNDGKWKRDVYSRLGAASGATSSMGLGISVTDPYTRHPALTAQATATLAELAPGRLTVVLGAGSHFDSLPGYGVDRPLLALREAVDLIRDLWSNKRVTLDGEVVRFRDGQLDVPVPNPPPLWIASRGPKILELAGKIADGVLIGSFATPPGVEYARAFIDQGLERVGRVRSAVEFASWLYVSVLDAEDEPVPAAVRNGVSYALWSSRPALTAILDRLSPDVTNEFRDFMVNAPHDWSAPTMDRLRQLIPRGVLDSLALVGTAGQIVDRLSALQSAGIEHVVIWPFPKAGQTMPIFLRKLAADVLPALNSRPE